MDSLRDEIECARALTRFASFLDQRRYDELIALTTPDCIWSSQKTVFGHAEIRARLDTRPADRKTLHIVTNLIVEIEGSGAARSRSCILIYRFDKGMALPVPTTAPHAIASCEDRLVKLEGRWLIAERRMMVIAQQPE